MNKAGSLFFLLSYQEPGRKLWPFCAGIALGLLALTRPAYAYLFWFLVACAGLLLLFARTRRPFAGVIVVFLVAYGATTLPWIMRNATKFGEASITDSSYGPRALCHRLAYNSMTWPEWRAAFVFWLPLRGPTWSAQLFPKSQYEKLLNEVDNFLKPGNAICKEAIGAASGTEGVLGHLLATHVWSDLAKHTAVSLLLGLRGLAIASDGRWTLLGWAAVFCLLAFSLFRRDWAFPLLCVPAFFNVAFYAAVSASVSRYNIVLVPILAYAMAYVLFWSGRLLHETATARRADRDRHL